MSAGLVGFLVILALVVAAILLFRSMMKHMRRVPERFDTAGSEDADAAGGVGAEPDQSSDRD